MDKATKNPTDSETAEIQEPTESLDETEVTTEDESGTVEEQPKEVSETEKATGKKQAKGVDLIRVLEKKLTPAELKAFKTSQAEFTKKSQTLSEYEKKISDYEGYYKDLMTDPEVAAILKSRQAKAEKEKEPDFSKMSDEEIFNYTVDKRVKAITAELESKMDTKYGTYIQSKLVAEGNKLISEFAASKKIPEEEVRGLAKYAVEHRLTLEEAYKVGYPDHVKQEALDDLDLKKKANLELGNIPSGATTVLPEKPTVKQALEAAMKTTGIKLKE